MPWQKGQSGNAQGPARRKPIRDQIDLVLNEYHEIEDHDGKTKRIKKLRMLAEVLVNKALEGEVTAIKEVCDRMDGKAVQQVDMNVTDDRTPEEMTDAELAETIRAASVALGRNGKKAKSANGSGSVH